VQKFSFTTYSLVTIHQLQTTTGRRTDDNSYHKLDRHDRLKYDQPKSKLLNSSCLCLY